MGNFKDFLKRKDIVFSSKRYLQEGLSAMAMGLFASLLIGLIIKTIANQVAISFDISPKHYIIVFFVTTGVFAMEMVGAAIGAAVSWSLKSPPLVVFTSVVVGHLSYQAGGPAGAFVAVCIASEFGKAISKETKLDIILTPTVTLLTGALSSLLIGPTIKKLMTALGDSIMVATEWQPFFFGIFIAVIVGLTLTAPISSAALCIMLELEGLAAGAATVGCAAQMMGFAVISYKDNNIGGFFAQAIGTSMLQISNIVKNPWILLPPTLASAIIGPLSTTVFFMENNKLGAGMGTSGLVGQIGTLTVMGFSMDVLLKVLLLHIALPLIISYLIYIPMVRMKLIKEGDLKLNM